MQIAVTGSSGLIGSVLGPFLAAGGHRVVRMVRSPKVGSDAILWDPGAGIQDPARLEGFDVVVHLAGENLVQGRWTPEKKQRIRDSRITGTRLLSQALAGLREPPKVLICASAIGYYGHRGDEVLTETSPPGSGFLAEVCQAWEAAAESARQRGIRVVSLRTGVVLSAAGGALAFMRTPFQLGVGGPLGSGQQYMSWIALDDLLGLIHHALLIDRVRGPLNTVAPNPVTNMEFTKTLGHVLRRPTVFPVPPFALRLLMGEVADEVLLTSTRAMPTQALQTQYTFRYPHLEEALRHVLGRP